MALRREVDTLVVVCHEVVDTLVEVSHAVVASHTEDGRMVEEGTGGYIMAVVFQLEEVRLWVVSKLGEAHKWVC